MKTGQIGLHKKHVFTSYFKSFSISNVIFLFVQERRFDKMLFPTL